MQENNYDEEPVVYCAKCYSLKIKHEDSIGIECCGDCGCSDLEEATIEEWEKKYEARYGHKYTTKSNDYSKHPIYQMSLEELKDKALKIEHWEEFIHTIYNKFPKGLSKLDSFILFFDKAIKDHKLNEVKILMIKYLKN